MSILYQSETIEYLECESNNELIIFYELDNFNYLSVLLWKLPKENVQCKRKRTLNCIKISVLWQNEKNIQASETAGGASLAVDLPECSFFYYTYFSDNTCIYCKYMQRNIKTAKKRKSKRVALY